LFNINNFKEGDEIEKYDFKKNVFFECYSSAINGEKEKAINIIKNQDFLQYHYFAQDYAAVKSASYIIFMCIKYNDIKTYVGFLSIASPTLNKILRNRYFGKTFLKKYYSHDKRSFYNITRVVLLPSYRGLSLGKYFVDYTLTTVMEEKNINFLEMSSNMLHTYDFSGNIFNKFFIDSKNILNKTQYEYLFKGQKGTMEEKKKRIKGYKGESKLIANYVFHFNPKLSDFFVSFYKKEYGVNIDFNINNEISAEYIIKGYDENVPYILLKHSNKSYDELKIIVDEMEKNEKLLKEEIKNEKEKDFLDE